MNNSRESLTTRFVKATLPRIRNVGAGGLISLVVFLSVANVGQTQTNDKLESRVTQPRAVDLTQPLTVSWHYDSNQTLNLTPAVADNRVYLPLAGGTVISLMAANGQLNWRADMGGELSASPIADQASIFVASETGAAEKTNRSGSGIVRALGREGGVTQWMRALPMPLRRGLAVGNNKLFGGGSDGKFYALDSKSGETRWFFAYTAPFNSQPVVADGRVYIGSEDGSLLAFDEGTGKLLWRYRTRGPVRGPVATGNDVVYFGSRDGYVYAVSVTNGLLAWRNRTGAGVEAVARSGEHILVASLDNFVYKFSFAGARLWKRRLPGRIASQPLVTAEAALFMPFSSSSGVVLELRAGRQVNLLPAGEEIAISASPIAIGKVVLLTTEHGLLAFSQPSEKPLTKAIK